MPYPGSAAKELWAMIQFAQTITVVYANETIPHGITVRNFTTETDEIDGHFFEIDRHKYILPENV